MDIKLIKTDVDDRAALTEIETLMAATLDSPEGERLDLLVTLVEAYERHHYPMDLSDPAEAIRFEMEQNGLTPKDLEPRIGRPIRVYEILSRKRPLTLNCEAPSRPETALPQRRCASFWVGLRARFSRTGGPRR